MTMGTGPGRLAGPTLAVGLLLGAVSCGGDDATTGPSWGPLAVAEFSGGDDAFVAGTLRITGNCVRLAEGDGSVLLVWPSARTRWDGQDVSVRFETTAGEQVSFHDGDWVTLTGSRSSAAENADEFLESVAWVSRPDRECVVDTRWFVSDTVKPGLS